MVIRRRGRIRIGPNKWANVGTRGITSFSSKYGNFTFTQSKRGGIQTTQHLGKGISAVHYSPPAWKKSPTIHGPKKIKIPKYRGRARGYESHIRHTGTGTLIRPLLITLVCAAAAAALINASLLALPIFVVGFLVCSLRARRLQNACIFLGAFKHEEEEILETHRELIALYEQEKKINEFANKLSLRPLPDGIRYNERNPDAKAVNVNLSELEYKRSGVKKRLLDLRTEAVSQRLELEDSVQKAIDNRAVKIAFAVGIFAYPTIAAILFFARPGWLLRISLLAQKVMFVAPSAEFSWVIGATFPAALISVFLMLVVWSVSRREAEDISPPLDDAIQVMDTIIYTHNPASD
jgi:hypothetical protein